MYVRGRRKTKTKGGRNDQWQRDKSGSEGSVRKIKTHYGQIQEIKIEGGIRVEAYMQHKDNTKTNKT